MNALPHQLQLVSPEPYGKMDSQVGTYKTSEDIRNTLNTNFHVDAKYLLFSFSASASYNSMQDDLTEHSSYISEVNEIVHTANIDFHGQEILTLSLDAQKYIENEIQVIHEAICQNTLTPTT